jgi:hypothetical protein
MSESVSGMGRGAKVEAGRSGPRSEAPVPDYGEGTSRSGDDNYNISVIIFKTNAYFRTINAF